MHSPELAVDMLRIAINNPAGFTERARAESGVGGWESMGEWSARAAHLSVVAPLLARIEALEAEREELGAKVRRVVHLVSEGTEVLRAAVTENPSAKPRTGQWRYANDRRVHWVPDPSKTSACGRDFSPWSDTAPRGSVLCGRCVEHARFAGAQLPPHAGTTLIGDLNPPTESSWPNPCPTEAEFAAAEARGVREIGKDGTVWRQFGRGLWIVRGGIRYPNSGVYLEPGPYDSDPNYVTTPEQHAEAARMSREPLSPEDMATEARAAADPDQLAYEENQR
jgi:hypothetical protein